MFENLPLLRRIRPRCEPVQHLLMIVACSWASCRGAADWGAQRRHAAHAAHLRMNPFPRSSC